MNGVDILNQRRGGKYSLEASIKCVRWTTKFFVSMFNIAVTQACYVWEYVDPTRKTAKRAHHTFLKLLQAEMIDFDEDDHRRMVRAINTGRAPPSKEVLLTAHLPTYTPLTNIPPSYLHTPTYTFITYTTSSIGHSRPTYLLPLLLLLPGLGGNRTFL
jgi:hypothetical protein